MKFYQFVVVYVFLVILNNHQCRWVIYFHLMPRTNKFFFLCCLIWWFIDICFVDQKKIVNFKFEFGNFYEFFFCDSRTDETEKDDPLKHDFDIFIFTQSWPVSVCLKWKEKSEANQCSLPSPKEIWTIHGIW